MAPRTLAIAALVAVLAAACSGDDDSTLPTGPDPGVPSDLEAHVVLDTKYGGIAEPERTVIRDRGAWEALWDRLRAAGEIEPVPTPPVDFARNIAILAILGERDRGGYDIDIPDLARSGGQLVATVRLTVPGGTCSQPEVLTTPLTIVTVSEPAAPVRFEETTVVQDC